MEPCSEKRLGPVRIPCTSSAPRMTASGGVPGMPSTRVGMKPPPTVALLADSVACTPSISPLPKRSTSEEHKSEHQSLRRTSYAVVCLKKKNDKRSKEQ